ncbi:hypothetical protein LNV08_11165 [Paucibacter sp. TC2R-5]|uniref:hypothetical protein n=1 Tax=Paucibacter sp. TC2R-5 TaxID=2893555 RepID=UPI0021E470AF|nr:hypothetical protein [Paucibacter sp. TC2R-5]MCV2359529.1 hypothetical protein [Paucibacter sp. TC2R-5]
MSHSPAAAMHPDPAAHGVAPMAEYIAPIWARQLEAIQATLHSGSVELLSNFASIFELQDQLHCKFAELPPDSAHTEALHQIDTDLQAQCERALHGLQFADRLSQMVDILHKNIERFSAELPHMNTAGEAERQAWAAAFEASFTTEEQHLFHHGKPPPPRQDNVEYF